MENTLQQKLHDTCIICGQKNPVGLKVKFDILPDQSVSAEFMCKFMYEGYKGFMQGGIIASLLDSAMTNCLFAHNIAAFTAEFNLKYKKPVRCGSKITVSAHMLKDYDPLYIMQAEVIQNGQSLVTAEAKFMKSELLK
jgi:acyl-coenzyme A thioesterase PaaI-like protein